MIEAACMVDGCGALTPRFTAFCTRHTGKLRDAQLNRIWAASTPEAVHEALNDAARYLAGLDEAEGADHDAA